MTEPEFDENRELCPDGACLGIVVDGKCNVCGLGADGTPAPGASAISASAELADTTDALDDDRQLCPDGACIGVIGPDGKCKTCGLPLAS